MKISKSTIEKDNSQTLMQQFDFPYLTDNRSGLNQELVAAYQPFTQQVEAFRTIRSQLMLHWFNEDKKTLAIVSPNNGEGRSYLTANLAIVFAQLGVRTLLIDTNLRQPRQHQLFNLGNCLGLSELLANHADLSVIHHITDLKNLFVLAAGTIPPNPLELINRGLSRCLEQVITDYDIILLDTPAVSNGSDVQLIARVATGVLLLARRHETRISEIEETKHILDESGVICVGAIMSDF